MTKDMLKDKKTPNKTSFKYFPLNLKPTTKGIIKS